MPLPPLDRRVALLGLSTALLAACKPGAPTSLGPATLDTNRLAGGFETLRVRALPAAFGFGVALMSGGGQWISDATARFPLQSVFKAFLAAAALALVDAGQLKLAEPMVLTAQDRAFGWDPLVVAWRGPTMTLPVVDLIALAVQQSDNTAADAVMKRIGGPAAVTAWLRGKGIEIIEVPFKDTMTLGCNVVALGNDRVLLPASSHFLKDRLRALGFQVYDPEIDMIANGGGGVHCMCQPLRRDPV